MMGHVTKNILFTWLFVRVRPTKDDVHVTKNTLFTWLFVRVRPTKDDGHVASLIEQKLGLLHSLS